MIKIKSEIKCDLCNKEIPTSIDNIQGDCCLLTLDDIDYTVKHVCVHCSLQITRFAIAKQLIKIS